MIWIEYNSYDPISYTIIVPQIESHFIQRANIRGIKLSERCMQYVEMDILWYSLGKNKIPNDDGIKQ